MYRLTTFATRSTVGGLGGSTSATTARTLSSSFSSVANSTSATLSSLTNGIVGSGAAASTTTAARLFSTGLKPETFTSLQYPNAKEPPVITQTQAKLIRGQPPLKKDSTVPPTAETTAVREPVSPDFVAALRQRKLSPGVSAIGPTIPPEIPSNVPSDQLETPETLITTLDNGVRVVSMETYGQVSVVGAVSAVGSQWEQQPGPSSPGEAHSTQLLEALAFGTTKHRNGLQIAQALQDWGGTRFVNTGREQSLHCIDVLRPNVEDAVGLLAECLLEPVFDPVEVEEAKLALQYQALDLPPELWLAEALQMAAYGPQQPLGQAHFCPPNVTLDHLTAEGVEQYWQRHFVNNPHEIVLAGAGVRHDTLVRLTEQHFGHLVQQNTERQPLPHAVYHGGQLNLPHPTEDEFVRLGLIWPACGWHGDDLVATCVLQTLLGGGNSFSAGGPGKGMYSRLYRQVLNRFAWAESAEALTAFYNDNGIWGITGSCKPEKARDLCKVICDHVSRLATTPVHDEELDRARNMLKNNVLTQLESRLVLFEDLGRQVLTYGKREDMLTTCQRIDAISQDDLMRVAQKSLQHPPSIAAVGKNLDYVPRHDEVVRWFR